MGETDVAGRRADRCSGHAGLAVNPPAPVRVGASNYCPAHARLLTASTEKQRRRALSELIELLRVEVRLWGRKR